MAVAHKDWTVSVKGEVVFQGTLSKANMVFNSISKSLCIVGSSDVPVVLYRALYGPVDSKTLII